MAGKGDDSKFSIATTVTLALAVAAMVLVKEPLKSSRPPGAGMEMNGYSEELKARARLWEDPFAAVLKDVESRKKSGLTVRGEGPLPHASGAGTRKPSETVRVTVETQAERSGDDGLNRLKEDIFDHVQAGENITALIVMTAGGPYANDIESRIGDRYALEAALDVGCFVPESTEFLRYFTWRVRGEPVATPYEWYSRNKITRCGSARQKIDRVLVLWVKADDYKDRILAGTDQLITQLLSETNPDQIAHRTAQHSEIKLNPEFCHSSKEPAGGKSVSKYLCENIVFKLVGPRSSTELLAMLLEIQARQESKAPPFSWPFENGRIDLYSPWATAMPGLLSYGMRGEEGNACTSYHTCNEAFGYWLAQANIRVDYRIDSDKILFDELFRELDRRQVIVGQDPIVLIGEWDSFYARALPITFSATACHYISDATIAKLNPSSKHKAGAFNGKCATTETAVDALMKGEISPQELNITRYSYLSGLDGESLEDQQKRSKPKSEDKEKENAITGKLKPRGLALSEKPEGTSQLDYVRRLVSRITSEQRRVKAIGILGRDAYDALLILQAVREQFPTVLFFATDLYARYFHDSELKWTRNLLIVSHFGLQLDPPLQQSIPPFRNAYQTSTFLAALMAIDRLVLSTDRGDCGALGPACYVLARGEQKSVQYSTELPPRLYEIGRYGAVDLSVSSKWDKGKTVHPPRSDVAPGENKIRLPGRIFILWVPLLVLLMGSVWSYGRLWHWLATNQVGRKERIYRTLFVVTIVVLLGLCLLLLWWIAHSLNYAEDEPFSLSDGVSIWPTELLRLLTGILSAWFMIKGAVDLRDNTTILEERFVELSETEEIRRKHGFSSNFAWIFHGWVHYKPVTVAELWTRYRGAHSCGQRTGRIAILLAVYVSVMFPLLFFMNDGEFHLFVPCRGSFSCGVDPFALLFSVVPLLILNFSVLDSVLLCARWIAEMPRAAGMNQYPAVRLIVERTRIVNRRILYPFLALFIMIAARSHYFDDWDFPPALIMILAANSLVALASATILYMVAVKSRRDLVESLEAKDTLLIAPESTQGERSDRVRKVIDEIGSIQQGAFVPFYQQPVVQAALVTVLAFLQYWFLGQ